MFPKANTNVNFLYEGNQDHKNCALKGNKLQKLPLNIQKCDHEIGVTA